MTKEEIAELLKETNLDEEILGPVVDKVFETYSDGVKGLINKRDELLEKVTANKTQKQEFETLKEEYETKLEKYKAIDDPDAALEALERIKNSPKEQELDELIAEKTEKLTKSLREENESLRTISDQTIRDQKAEIEKLNSAIRKQDFEYRLEKVASKMQVPEFAREDFTYRMSKAFRYNEEEEKFIAIGDDGEVIRDPGNPVQPINFETYAEKILKPSAHHIFAQNVNPNFTGNDGRSQDVSKYFKENGKPTMDGYQLRDKDEKEFNRLKSQVDKKIQKTA